MENYSEPFLIKLVKRILHEHPIHMHRACIVLPGRRTGIFLKRHLCAAIQSPAFSPGIYSIEDFVFELSGLHQADQLLLLWELYVCYSETVKTDAQSFEEFLKWGSVLLQDFEDVDMHLADSQTLFNYLSEARAIELWNPGKDKLSQSQQKYLAFFRSLADLHVAFSDHLVQRQMAYKGLAFRQLSGSLLSKVNDLQWDHFYFAGFNAITPAEKRIMDTLSEKRKVTMLFDADAYYIDDPRQEAGKYLREIIKQNNAEKFEWTGKDLLQGSKTIQVIGVPHTTGQVMVAGSILAGIDHADAGNTVVVLNDESLLLPMLNAIPENIGHFNVTMGYPFTLTPVYSLMENLFNMHLHTIERKQQPEAAINGNVQVRYYFRNVFSLLKHAYVQKLLVKKDEGKDPVADMLAEGRIFYIKEEITDHFDGNTKAGELLSLVFSDWSLASYAIAKLIAINHLLASSMAEDDEGKRHQMDLEYLYQFSLILNRLQLLVSRAGEELSLRGLQQLLKSVTAGTQLPFVGEPLKGLQIMGMLETRTLDFKNVIMLSVNEGVLPAGKRGNSFVPFDIRREFGLPVYSDRDAVFAYHFYRLLQRCETMTLIYNTTPDEMGGGEKSRFILQIEHELQREGIQYSERFYSPAVSLGQVSQTISVDKSPDIIARLTEMAQHGLSPTALTTYVNCPLKFYFTYVLKVSEDNTPGDSMDAPTFGTGIHETLKSLYEPFVKKPLTVAMLDSIASEANPSLHEQFLKAYNNNDINYGKNLLMLKVAESFLKRFIRLEKELLESLQQEGKHLTIDAVEYEFGTSSPIWLEVPFAGNDHFKVRLRGKADRIDRIGSAIRVIDYKTGSVKPADLKLKEWDELFNNPDKTKSLQLLMYAWLYAKEFKTGLPDSGIISFRQMKSGFMKVTLPDAPEVVMGSVENVLNQLLQQIFDVSLPFYQTDDARQCDYCPFKDVCGR
jgi:ATP-dependent helicase/nuclease subunit B